MFAGRVWRWMACLPPMSRSSSPMGMTAGSTHTGAADRPAFSHASLVNCTFSVGVLNFGAVP